MYSFYCVSLCIVHGGCASVSVCTEHRPCILNHRYINGNFSLFLSLCLCIFFTIVYISHRNFSLCLLSVRVVWYVVALFFDLVSIYSKLHRVLFICCYRAVMTMLCAWISHKFPLYIIWCVCSFTFDVVFLDSIVLKDP